MTPIKQLASLRLDFLTQINTYFEQHPEVYSIEFEPVENHLDIEPTILSSDGTLVLLDEDGNDSDVKLTDMSIDVMALLLTLIQTKNFEVYEKV